MTRTRRSLEDLRKRFPYPRRRVVRAILRRLIDLAFFLLSDLEIVGQENVPSGGPLLVVGNHFHYADPVLMIKATPRPIEFVGGLQMPNAPFYITWIPKVWGYYSVRRGGYSRHALRAAEAVLAQDGVLGIFPEAGSWATVLRPPRPGAAFLAVRTGARLLPMGFDGLIDVFPSLGRGRRARVTARIGRPFGPFGPAGPGQDRRRHLEEIGDEIMRQIAALIPPERRGHYAEDPAIRAAARGTEVYPWAEEPEG